MVTCRFSVSSSVTVTSPVPVVFSNAGGACASYDGWIDDDDDEDDDDEEEDEEEEEED